MLRTYGNKEPDPALRKLKMFLIRLLSNKKITLK